MNSWFAVMAPAGTPKAAIDKFQSEITRALADPGVREQFAAQGLSPLGSSPAELAVMLRAQLARYSKLIKEAGITAS
jgi:tripartite-type tricarboxylate transporter receptor subunit TctC